MNIIYCSTSRAIRLLLFAFLVAMAPIVIAQQPRTGSISGQVIADAGVSMGRVTVRLSAQVRDETGRVLARVTSPDREGRFVFNGLPQRAYVITASAPGYISRRDVNATKTYLRLGDTTTIELSKGGVISGRVANRRGEGVVMTRVVAIPVRDESGGPVVSAFTPG